MAESIVASINYQIRDTTKTAESTNGMVDLAALSDDLGVEAKFVIGDTIANGGTLNCYNAALSGMTNNYFYIFVEYLTNTTGSAQLATVNVDAAGAMSFHQVFSCRPATSLVVTNGSASPIKVLCVAVDLT